MSKKVDKLFEAIAVGTLTERYVADAVIAGLLQARDTGEDVKIRLPCFRATIKATTVQGWAVTKAPAAMLAFVSPHVKTFFAADGSETTAPTILELLIQLLPTLLPILLPLIIDSFKPKPVTSTVTGKNDAPAVVTLAKAADGTYSGMVMVGGQAYPVSGVQIVGA